MDRKVSYTKHRPTCANGMGNRDKDDVCHDCSLPGKEVETKESS